MYRTTGNGLLKVPDERRIECVRTNSGDAWTPVVRVDLLIAQGVVGLDDELPGRVPLLPAAAAVHLRPLHLRRLLVHRHGLPVLHLLRLLPRVLVMVVVVMVVLPGTHPRAATGATAAAVTQLSGKHQRTKGAIKCLKKLAATLFSNSVTNGRQYLASRDLTSWYYVTPRVDTVPFFSRDVTSIFPPSRQILRHVT